MRENDQERTFWSLRNDFMGMNKEEMAMFT
jgi:hypothetical protein